MSLVMQETRTFIKRSAGFLNKTFGKRSANRDPERIKKVVVNTLAGTGEPGLEDGHLLKAQFRSPLDVTLTPDGTIYVADGFNSCIRQITGELVKTFAGNGNANIRDGIGDAARFKIPCRITSDSDGNLYVLDAADPRIRKIRPVREVTTHTGMKTFGFRDGDRASAQLGQSFGIAVDAENNIYVADSQNDSIRKISANGHVTTRVTSHKKMFLNDSPDIVEFNYIKGILIDKHGNLFVADMNRILKITPGGVVFTVAGNGMKAYKNEKWETIFFSRIEDLVMDEQENLYLSEGNRILRITSEGNIAVIAGSVAGYEDGVGVSAKFNEPRGMGIDKHGNLYVADSGNNRIRKISFE